MSRLDSNFPKFIAIIPAYPGFHVLEVAYGVDDTCEAVRYPIVAWALDDEFLIPFPVTLEGVRHDSCHILQPDGTVERPGVDGARNVDEWLRNQSCGETQNDAAHD